MRRALIAVGAATLLGGTALLFGAPALADLVEPPSSPEADSKPARPAAPPPASSPTLPPVELPGATAPSEHEGVIVARVGNLTISAAELDRRLAQTPPFQLTQFGSTAEEIRRGFLDKVMVKELLVVREAEDRKLAERPELADRVRATYRSALIVEVRREVGQGVVTDDDVKAYYAANLQKFVAPQKVALFRILVPSEAEAKAIIAQLGSSPDVKKFGEIAREKSLDKETAMRGGNLGFVQPDGETGQRGQKVDVALIEATKSLKDGELAPEPVKEGRHFAVVWKRQTMRAVTRPLETERAGIRQVLAQERMQGAMNKLLEGLRTGVEQHPEMVEVIAIDPQGEMSRAVRPGTLPRSKRGAQPRPEQGPIGPR